MKHRNSVLHGLLQHLDWHQFDQLVAEHEADKHVRTLSTKTQFIALAYGQLSGANTLRDIITALDSYESHLYHLGARPVKRSTLSDANTLRPCALFEQLFAATVGRAHSGLRRTMREATYLIDSTSVKLSQLSADWSRYSAKVCGAKVHVIYDPDANQPIYAAFTTANVNDITAAQDMPITEGATYVFDLGYYDYRWWAELQAKGCRIVTRLKKNTNLTFTRERLVPPGGPILSDRFGTLPARQASSRHNPMNVEMREVRVRIDTGKVLRILTNDLTSPAQEIADLYKRRWMIELFFRWIKQVLRIKRFIGTSENAVRIQIAVALIVFLLLRVAHAALAPTSNLLVFVRLVRAHLMQRREIHTLFHPEQPSQPDTRQLSLVWEAV